MLWRVRTTLSDRPGSLARLARRCGHEQVNILALQIFPGIGGVTDELVLHSPASWDLARVAALVESAGGTQVSVGSCTEHALVDGPSRYLGAVQRVLHEPGDLPGVLAGLLDGRPEPLAAQDPLAAVGDRLAVKVGERTVAVRRTPAFTAGEHARAAAFAELATMLQESSAGPLPVAPGPRPGPTARVELRAAAAGDAAAVGRMHRRCSAATVERCYRAPAAGAWTDRLLAGSGVLATVADEVVGAATISEVEDGRARLALIVEDGWQRRGTGTRLLAAAARLGASQGAVELVLRGADPAAAVALAFASGLRARVGLGGEAVEVAVGVTSTGSRAGRQVVPQT